MEKTLVIYGSTTGTCQGIAKKIAAKLSADCTDVTKLSADALADYQTLVIGTSTWGYGELQDDWLEKTDELKSADLSGKKVALFGCGDADCYPDTFCDGIALLYNEIKDSGCSFVGEVATDGYSFEASAAVVDGKFLGLALDDVNQDDKTEQRIDDWLKTL